LRHRSGATTVYE